MLRNVPNIQYIGAFAPQVLHHSWVANQKPCTGLASHQRSGWVTLRDSSPAAGIRDVKAITGLCKPHLHKSRLCTKSPVFRLLQTCQKTGKDKHKLCHLDKCKALKNHQHFTWDIFRKKKKISFALRFRPLLQFTSKP